MYVTQSPKRRSSKMASSFGSRKIGSKVAVAVLIPVLLGVLSCAAQNGSSPSKPNPDSGSTAPAAATDAAGQPQPAKAADPAAAGDKLKEQIADETAQLVKLATELKTEVDKTTKDTLSLGVIRKADEIERLARSVKEKMKGDAGGS